MVSPSALSSCGLAARAWPFEEARKLLARVADRGSERPVLFETGYGPSGLPHIGTFGEVVRTAMVRHAFRILVEDKIATRLVCFSDDMDALRKVPDGLPHQDLLEACLGRPLTKTVNPFQDGYPSFAHHNNARMCRFLDQFGFEYEFISASTCYASGCFDEVLLRMLECYDAVMDVVLPTLREERRRTYAPFLPIHPETGVVVQAPLEERDVRAGAVVWTDPLTGQRFKTPVTGGGCKAQWKADWALRWVALGVDYEMAGKDLIGSMKLSGEICKLLGGRPPEGFHYELFLDEQGRKISKSAGNGLTVDKWLRYASPGSLSLFMYRAPRKAKRLYFDVIPRSVDDYLSLLESYSSESWECRVENPVWHIHSGKPPFAEMPLSFSLLLNLVSASNAEDGSVLWGFISRYAPHVTPKTHPALDALVGYAIAYFHDFVQPKKVYRLPNEKERAALHELESRLRAAPCDADAETVQAIAYAVGKGHGFENLRDWFKAIYEILLGQSQGPRFGSFVTFYGKIGMCDLIARGCAGELIDCKQETDS